MKKNPYFISFCKATIFSKSFPRHHSLVSLRFPVPSNRRSIPCSAIFLKLRSVKSGSARIRAEACGSLRKVRAQDRGAKDKLDYSKAGVNVCLFTFELLQSKCF